MAERFKAHAWKVCVPSQVPWVRIPLSPLKVTIQSDFKTLNEKDLNEISQKIVSNVEKQASAKLRS